MQNRHKVLELAREQGLALTKQVKCFGTDGQLRVLEVDRPLAELVDELREAGSL